MEPYNYTQGGNLHSVPGPSATNDPYSDFQRAMNDSGVSMSADGQYPPVDQHHYQASFQQYGEKGSDVSRQVEDYLKQWANYYETQHGQDPKIRYDYKAFQNQSDPGDLTQSNNEQGAQSDAPAPAPQQGQKRKIGIVSPNFNFVKASTEFKSTDLAEKKEEKMKNVMVPTVLAGKNRLGLGAASKKGSQSTAAVSFVKGGKASTVFLETKFTNLCKEIKARNSPDRGAIEMLHQCVNKCKMQINDVYHTNDRMPDGRVKYTCNLEINGVFISNGGAPSKKVAKMDAYAKAMSLLTNPPIAVKTNDDGELHLMHKVEIGPTKPEPSPAKPNITTNKQKNQTTNEASMASFAEKAKDSYTKPKMIFHKAGEPVKTEGPPAPTAHPLSDKPLEFKKSETTSADDTMAPTAGHNTPSTSTDQGTGRFENFNQGRGQFRNRPGRGNMQNFNANRFQRPNYHHDRGRGGFDRHGYDRPYYRNDNHGYGQNFGHGQYGFERPNYPHDDYGYERQDYPPENWGGFERQDRPSEDWGDYGRPDHPSEDWDGYERPGHPQEQWGGYERKQFQPAGYDRYKREEDRFDNPSAVKKVKKGGHVVLDDLSDFIIMDSSIIAPNITATSILHNSANFNRVILKYQFEEIAGFGWRCKLLLSDEVVASSFGSTKEDAKKAAGEEALSTLQGTCYTIKVKQDVDNDEDEGMTKDEFVSEIKKGGNVIPDNNIGNMLLRKMGWAGGGVGKHGTGIAEPIKADQVIGREGLGLTASKGIDKSFHEKVQRILVDYTRSNDQNDLHFSPEFSKEERAMIHKAAQKYGLKSHSKGKDDARFLIISRKRSAPQLLDHVMSSGGTTSKYEVIPPKSQQNDEEYFARDRQPVWNAVSYGHDKQ